MSSALQMKGFYSPMAQEAVSSIRLYSSVAPTRSTVTTIDGSQQDSKSDISSSRTISNEDDARYMKLALRMAQHAYREKEVPIGAVVVDSEGNIVSTGRNQVEEKHDATAHAEINALKEAANFKNNWRLLNCTLFTTLEPCMMCLGAIQGFRISRVVYAAKDLRLGACGSWQSLHEVNHPYHRSIQITGGVGEEESSLLLKRFFASLRTEKFRYPGYNVGRGITDPEIQRELQLSWDSTRNSIA